ncbi:hypothetical protein [Actinomadura harenae]|uniref:hypothetical protein n=1 Tax=Actinomadura harenae TaxID=2483351 RepID=UPI0011C3CD94|nr:hypothetical protein [Actinomadura harenae]
MGTFEWWDDVFQRLPRDVLDDYLRILRVVHRHFEGRIIRAPGVKGSDWISIDDAGRLSRGPADASHFTPNPYAGERGQTPLAVGHLRDLMAAYPDCRCGALVRGDVLVIFRLPGSRRIVDTAVDVHLAHRPPAGVEHGFFRFPFETEGRLVRRMRMDPDTVEFVERER